ncbi:MAG: phytoene desaturase [candidate division WOR-3 bacterium]|nr:MAG: phytoene desaturase [candidate division WOR-3 bacterium]
MGQKRVAVIGAGIGGLSTAAYLAAAGYQVDVYEKNSEPGGKASVLNASGFRFDKGPSLLTMPFVFEEHFRNLGVNPQDYVGFERLSTNCRYFYPDGITINAYADKKRLSQEFAANTRTAPLSIDNYFRRCGRIYELAADLFLFDSPLTTFRNPTGQSLSTLTHLGELGMFTTLNKINCHYFKDRRAVQLFNRYATYNGSSPYNAPATFLIIPHVEFTFGAYNVCGGINSIPQALFAVAKQKGARFHFTMPVTEIVHENHRIRGIKFDNTEMDCDVVVANSDVRNVYRILLKDHNSPMARLYAGKEPSSSALVFYWGIKGNFKDLEVHNIFFSHDYQKEFQDMFRKKHCPDDPTIYINITSKYVETDAPRGCENWFVMINAPYVAGQDWSSEVAKIRKRIIEKLNRILSTDIEKRIVYESVLTPPDIEKETGSVQGSLYGMASNTVSGAFMRQQNRSFIYRGLYFCGGTCHPGGGMPLALLSGKIASHLVMKGEK